MYSSLLERWFDRYIDFRFYLFQDRITFHNPERLLCLLRIRPPHPPPQVTLACQTRRRTVEIRPRQTSNRKRRTVPTRGDPRQDHSSLLIRWPAWASPTRIPRQETKTILASKTAVQSIRPYKSRSISEDISRVFTSPWNKWPRQPVTLLRGINTTSEEMSDELFLLFRDTFLLLLFY